LKSSGIANWRSKKRPVLTASHARRRLQWAQQNRHTDWSRWLFSDECSVEKGKGKKRAWSFGYPAEKWSKARIDEQPKGKQLAAMVWCAIGLSIERSELIIMERDGKALRGGYTAISYIDALEQGLLPIYDGQTFQQDNASVHTAQITTQFLQQYGIFCIPNWPAISPDLNPIEHMWPRLKELIYELRPDIDNIRGQEAQLMALRKVLPLV
jgi:hypothetical protein